MSSCILNDVWVSTGEIVPLCGAEEPLVAGKKTSNAHVGGDEMESEMFWEIGKKKEEEEGLKVSTKFFSAVSKFACSYMNSCTIRCCFRERITAANILFFFRQWAPSEVDEHDVVVIRSVYTSLNITERGLKGIWVLI